MSNRPEQFFRPANWSKYQGYKKRGPSWIKLHASLLKKPEWIALTSNEKVALISMWVNYADHGRPFPVPETGRGRRMVASRTHLSRVFDTPPTHLSRVFDTLLSSNFIELCSDSVANSAISVAQSQRTESEKTPVPKKEPRPKDLLGQEIKPKANGTKVNGAWTREPFDKAKIHDLNFVKSELWAMGKHAGFSSMIGKLLKRNGDDHVHAYLVLRKCTSPKVGNGKQMLGRAIDDALVPYEKGVNHRRAGAIFADDQGWWRVTDEGGKDRRIIGYKKGA